MKRGLKNLILLLAVFAALPAYAQKLSRPTVYPDLTEYYLLAQGIANWLYAFALVFGVIMLIWAAFMYLSARDDEKQIEKAKQTIVYAIIGLVIAMLAAGVPAVLKNLLGV